ncbi:MAG: threonine/serine dehydratase [Planctomycetota bacterium]
MNEDANPADLRERAEAAARRSAGEVRETGLEESPWLSRRSGARVLLKLENQQRSGSFKFRGAMARLSALSADDARRGVVVASSGNHGAACALAGRLLGVPVRVFVPTYAKEGKRRKILGQGAALESVGDDCLDTERAARACAEREGLVYVSPYDDLEVAAGQGTIGLELERQAPDLDAVFVAVGGGGLIGGVGAVLKTRRSEIEIVAASPERSPAVHACLEAGRWVDAVCEDTLSDATAGGVDPDSVTLPLCRAVVDRSLLVPEDEIGPALRAVFDEEGLLVEGAAAMAVAAFLATGRTWAGRTVAIILCGGNLDAATARRWLAD